MKHLTLVEIDTPAWEITSPAGPTRTWRFAEATAELPIEFDAIPSILSVNYEPAIVSLGKNLGQRARITVTFRDHRHIFAGEPFEQGTFWGKWRARYGTKLRGRNFRLIRGLQGQSLAEMETFHFVIESVDGPTPDGKYSVVATDILKLADGDRALAPRPSNGFLIAPIDADDTQAILSPSGVGDAEYPASGYVNIGGKEICAFTRSGDTLTLTRATTIPGFSFETEVVEHDAGSRVQLCLPYIAEDPADIIADLLENYAGVPSEYIPLVSWKSETGAYLQNLYTTLITEPTAVNKLVSELVEQAALALWWDSINKRIRLQVLRPIPTTAAKFTEETIISGSLRTREQPDTRLSDVLTYFALRNPLRPIDETDNYRSALLTVDLEAIDEYNGRANKIIHSRWIPFGARTVAQRLNNIQLGRFRDPPRRINFAVPRRDHGQITLGGGYQIGWTFNQDITGQPVFAPIQVTRLNPMPDRWEVEAEEMLFRRVDEDDPSLTDRVVIIDSNINNINLRELHDNIYPEVTGSESPEIKVTFIIESGVIVGSTSTANPACDVGDWPPGVVPTLRIMGRIQGAGGDGGSATGPGPDLTSGQPGGPALYTRAPVAIEIDGGGIWGGGGGGAPNFPLGAEALGGGGGAGQFPGRGGEGVFDNGRDGTTESGGPGGQGLISTGGRGGDPGQPGERPDDLPPFIPVEAGDAGAAIDGISFVTFVSPEGDIRGPRIN